MSAPAKPGLGSSASHTVDRVETVDARMLVLTRCLLAFSAFAIIWIDPSEPKRLVELTYACLAGYCVYSTVLALISYRSDWPGPERAFHWIDVIFYACLVALTEGTSSIFSTSSCPRFWSPPLPGGSGRVSRSRSCLWFCSPRSD